LHPDDTLSVVSGIHPGFISRHIFWPIFEKLSHWNPVGFGDFFCKIIPYPIAFVFLWL